MTNSFVFIVEDERLNAVLKILEIDSHDFDILEESLGNVFAKINRTIGHCKFFVYILGEISLTYYLENDGYVPTRMIDRIDKVTSSVMENGYYQFHKSIADFKLKLRARMLEIQNPMHTSDDDEDDFQPLTYENMRIPFMFLLYMYGLAVIVFFGEILYSKWTNRRTGEYSLFQ